MFHKLLFFMHLDLGSFHLQFLHPTPAPIEAPNAPRRRRPTLVRDSRTHKHEDGWAHNRGHRHRTDDTLGDKDSTGTATGAGGDGWAGQGASTRPDVAGVWLRLHDLVSRVCDARVDPRDDSRESASQARTGRHHARWKAVEKAAHALAKGPRVVLHAGGGRPDPTRPNLTRPRSSLLATPWSLATPPGPSDTGSLPVPASDSPPPTVLGTRPPEVGREKAWGGLTWQVAAVVEGHGREEERAVVQRVREGGRPRGAPAGVVGVGRGQPVPRPERRCPPYVSTHRMAPGPDLTSHKGWPRPLR